MKYSGQMPTVQKDIGVLNGLMLAIEREVKLILVSGQPGQKTDIIDTVFENLRNFRGNDLLEVILAAVGLGMDIDNCKR